MKTALEEFLSQDGTTFEDWTPKVSDNNNMNRCIRKLKRHCSEVKMTDDEIRSFATS
jgi:hypothetical protein